MVSIDRIRKCVQLPILNAIQVESIAFSLRLTPFDKYGEVELVEFLKQFDDYIYSVEHSKQGKKHYHIAIWTSSMDEDGVREIVRKFLLTHFPVQKRGDANKQYNLSQVLDLEATVTYLLKDGGVIGYSSNIDVDSLDKLRKQSYKKFSKEEFAKQLEELKKKFKLTTPRLEEMMMDVVSLKAIYRQPVNMTQIYQMCVSFDIHNFPEKKEDYVREYLTRFKF